jgi:3-dehydroquinate dehydratase / shikimate dehydrogenase
MTVELRTERLLLRAWQPSDRPAFAALNADPRVMECFPRMLTQRESDDMAERIENLMDEQGWGLWAVEVPGVADFIGFVGLNYADATLGRHVVEVGWRLAAEHWGRGYAPEAARAALAYGFETLGLEEIVAFTATGNAKSRRVMDKIGMTYNPADDFDNPRVPPDSHLLRHVLYRIDRPAFARLGDRAGPGGA